MEAPLLYPAFKGLSNFTGTNNTGKRGCNHLFTIYFNLAAFQFSVTYLAIIPGYSVGIIIGVVYHLGKEFFIGYDAGAPCNVSINHSDRDGGLSSVYLEAGSILDWGDAMIDEDPRFADVPNDDYHLTGRSPCVNRGDSAAAPGEDF